MVRPHERKDFDPEKSIVLWDTKEWTMDAIQDEMKDFVLCEGVLYEKCAEPHYLVIGEKCAISWDPRRFSEVERHYATDYSALERKALLKALGKKPDAKIEVRMPEVIMSKFNVSLTWTLSGECVVRAKTAEEAVRYAKKHKEDIQALIRPECVGVSADCM